MYNIETVIDEIIVNTLINLGNRQKEKKEYALAKRSYKDAHERLVKLANISPRKYRPQLIESFIILAELYEEEASYALAIKEYREVISLARILLRETLELNYVATLAHISHKIANLHKEYHNRPLAQYFYTEALEHYTILLQESNYSHEKIAIFNLYLSLIALYEEESLFAHAQTYYKKALTMAQNLIDTGVESYNYEMGKLHCDLASLYFFDANFEEAKEHYLKALNSLLKFKEKNSENYKESLSIVYNNLASIYATEKNYIKALSHYKYALPHLSNLADNNPAKYGHNVAILFKNLASIYFHVGESKKAEFFHFKSIEIFEEFSEYNAQKYNLELASCIIDGVEYYDQHTLTLYNAEYILRSYEWNEEAEMLLGRISKLRKSKVKAKS